MAPRSSELLERLGLWRRRHRPPVPEFTAPPTTRDVVRILHAAEQLAELAGLDRAQAAELAERWATAPTPKPAADTVHLARPLSGDAAPDSMATDLEHARRGLGWVVLGPEAGSDHRQ